MPLRCSQGVWAGQLELVLVRQCAFVVTPLLPVAWSNVSSGSGAGTQGRRGRVRTQSALGTVRIKPTPISVSSRSSRR